MKPEQVRRAQYREDVEALRAMGRKGGKATAKRRRQEADRRSEEEGVAEEYRRRILEEMEEMANGENGRRDNLIPPDDR